MFRQLELVQLFVERLASVRSASVSGWLLSTACVRPGGSTTTMNLFEFVSVDTGMLSRSPVPNAIPIFGDPELVFPMKNAAGRSKIGWRGFVPWAVVSRYSSKN